MDASHEAAMQRLRDHIALYDEPWRLTVRVPRRDLAALLAALDAAGPLLAAADAYAEAWAVSRHLGGSLTAWAACDDLLQIAASRAIAQQPPAASPATMGAGEGA